MEPETEVGKGQKRGAGRVQRPRARAQRETTKSGKGISPGVKYVEDRNEFQAPTVDGSELTDRQHESLAAELADTRICFRLSNRFEPIQKFQLGDDGQWKGQSQEAASLLEFGAARTMMQPKMTNADKAIWQDMREEATDELAGGQGHDFLCAFVAIVEVFEGDGIFAHGEEAMVGDGNAEDVATEILNQFLGAIKGRLNVDFPILGQSVLEHGGDVECASIGIQFALCPQLREGEAETIAELMGQQFDRKKKFVRCRLPAVPSRRGNQRPAGDDEMEVEMLLHRLSPGMQDHRKADFPTEVFLPKLFEQLGGNFNEQVEE